VSQVDAVITDYPTEVVAGAMIAAYQQVMGTDPPSQTSWSFPLAQAVKAEGWAGNYAFNNNPGNLTYRFPPAVDWYYNPHVTNGLHFSSYDTLLDGCVAMLLALKAHGALAAADAGDSAGYAAALGGWYLGANGDYTTYGNNIAAGAQSYANLVPVPYSGASPLSSMSASQKLLLAGSAAVIAGAIWYGLRELKPSLLRAPRSRRAPARRRRTAYA
jgi:hypothetical protein